jgi:hypothetical protein
MTDYSLAIEERPGYLHAKVTGTNTRDNVLGYTREIFEACVARHCTAVLIEEDLHGPSLPLAGVLELIDVRVPQARAAGHRIAFVDVNPEHDRWRMEYAEDHTAQSGIDMRLFNTVEAARQWLKRHD